MHRDLFRFGYHGDSMLPEVACCSEFMFPILCLCGEAMTACMVKMLSA